VKVTQNHAGLGTMGSEPKVLPPQSISISIALLWSTVI